MDTIFSLNSEGNVPNHLVWGGTLFFPCIKGKFSVEWTLFFPLLKGKFSVGGDTIFSLINGKI